MEDWTVWDILNRYSTLQRVRNACAMRTTLLRNIERDLAFIPFIARTSYLVFVEETLSVNANALDNRKLVALMATECFCYGGIPVPIAEAGKCDASFRVVVAAYTKSGSRARLLVLHDFGPSFFHSLLHALTYLFNIR